MLYKTVDLYEYFGQTRPEGGRGYLKCMCLDVTEEVSTERRYPAVLIIPGGAYWFNSERESEPIALRYMKSGYSSFILSYTCAPYGAYPVSFREAAMAMVYIRQNAAQLHIDENKVAALGGSAGGHLCGCLTALFESGDIADITKEFSARPDASIFCYPVITMGDKTHEWTRENISGNDMALAESLSLEKRIPANAPPAFIWHTYDDEAVPVANSLMLASAYEAAGVPFELHIYGHGVHGMSTGDDTSYLAGSVPDHSREMPGWTELSISWLKDIGLMLED